MSRTYTSIYVVNKSNINNSASVIPFFYSFHNFSPVAVKKFHKRLKWLPSKDFCESVVTLILSSGWQSGKISHSGRFSPLSSQERKEAAINSNHALVWWAMFTLSFHWRDEQCSHFHFIDVMSNVQTFKRTSISSRDEIDMPIIESMLQLRAVLCTRIRIYWTR